MNNETIMILLPVFVAAILFVASVARTSKVKRRALYEIEKMITENKAKFKKEFKLIGSGNIAELDRQLVEKGYDKRSQKLVKMALMELYKKDHKTD